METLHQYINLHDKNKSDKVPYNVMLQLKDPIVRTKIIRNDGTPRRCVLIMT